MLDAVQGSALRSDPATAGPSDLDGVCAPLVNWLLRDGRAALLIHKWAVDSCRRSVTADDLIPRFNALLVEGVPGIGKSTLIDALIATISVASAVRQTRTIVHLCQTHTYRDVELKPEIGCIDSHPPRDRAFKARARRMRVFLSLEPSSKKRFSTTAASGY